MQQSIKISGKNRGRFKLRKREKGIKVKSVLRSSPFYLAGLRRGDIVVSVNGEETLNELDFHFLTADRNILLTVLRRGRLLTIKVEREEGRGSGVTLVEQPINRCANRCIFCFIDQMPQGLRRSLYVKDEDIRLSLISGNYLTLSSFDRRDLERVARLGLSPLYVSVHSTDVRVRRMMLGNPRAPEIMSQLSFLASRGIGFHTQIVVCPSYNDGKSLDKTVNDLLTLESALCSVAVVPVGLTKFRNVPLQEVNYEVAADVCRRIGSISDRAASRDGKRKVFLADEFLLKARLPIPEASYYEQYPQIENGVGLVRRLIDAWEEKKNRLLRRPEYRCGVSKKKRILVTSVSAFPFVRKIVEEMEILRPALHIEVMPIHNYFFGETVTVAGLLTAKDIIKQLKKELKNSSAEEAVIPAIVFNHSGFTLDGYSAGRIADRIGIPVRVIDSITELVD